MFSLLNVACQPSRPIDMDSDASLSVREGFRSHYRVLDSIIGLALIIIGSIAVAKFGCGTPAYVAIGLGALCMVPGAFQILKNLRDSCCRSCKGISKGEHVQHFSVSSKGEQVTNNES